MYIPFGVFSAAGIAGNSYELIATTNITTTGISSFSFTSIPQTYKSLQIRLTYQVNTSSTAEYGLVAFFNGDGSSTDNSSHFLYGNGSSVASIGYSNQNALGTIIPYPQISGSTINPSSYQAQFVAGIIDVLDYSSTVKNKTVRSFSGHTVGGTNNVTLGSKLWTDTSAVTSIGVYASNAPQFTVGSRFSLYGIRG